MSDAPVVSVVIPCLNEAETVAACVKEALAVLDRARLAGEVIVADNGSTDGSRELAAAAGSRVVAVPERGYGAALLGGIAVSRGRYVVMGDADMSYDFGSIPDFVRALEAGADLVMGSRFKGRSSRRDAVSPPVARKPGPDISRAAFLQGERLGLPLRPARSARRREDGAAHDRHGVRERDGGQGRSFISRSRDPSRSAPTRRSRCISARGGTLAAPPLPSLYSPRWLYLVPGFHSPSWAPDSSRGFCRAARSSARRSTSTRCWPPGDGPGGAQRFSSESSKVRDHRGTPASGPLLESLDRWVTLETGLIAGALSGSRAFSSSRVIPDWSAAGFHGLAYGVTMRWMIRRPSPFAWSADGVVFVLPVDPGLRRR
jgi:hypothetical protein